MNKISRALVSVSDKTGLIPFAHFLKARKVEILSTGGTLKALKEAGIPAKAVDSFTGFPEILEGRVKTLHPKIHGGLLYRRDKKTHVAEARKHGIEPIDLVVVNLYPFEKVTQERSVHLETAIENIDIGGPSMLRSAAKNYEAVAVVCDPADYQVVMREMEENKGGLPAEFRKQLALKVFEKTSGYDRAIADFLKNQNGLCESPKTEEALPARFEFQYQKALDLRYGENPHQPAAFYTPENFSGLPALKGAGWEQLHGKELSFNNLLDIEAACAVTGEFEKPAACVIKHNNPCGIAEDGDLVLALEKAIECDQMSAFGGIIGFNRPCTLKAAEMAFEKLKFFEVLIAPDFEAQALAFLKKRQNLRLIKAASKSPYPYDLRFLQSGVLVQKKDLPLHLEAGRLKKNLRFVTQARLDEAELEELLFAFKCVKVVKSNAIVITQGRQTVGIGAGQMSRVDSVEIACRKAGYRTDGGFLASDAFFPMPDSIEVAHDHKIRAIIQPGGSVRDADVIAACDRFGIAMAFTGERHFRH